VKSETIIVTDLNLIDDLPLPRLIERFIENNFEMFS